MKRSEALALVATLQAAFPAGNAGDETAALYAKLMEREDFAAAGLAVEGLVATRRDAFLPTWAEVRGEIVACRPRPRALPEPEGMPPTPEQAAALAAAIGAAEKRSLVLKHGAA